MPAPSARGIPSLPPLSFRALFVARMIASFRGSSRDDFFVARILVQLGRERDVLLCFPWRYLPAKMRTDG
ncbi:MAG: hypothetical protein CVU63_03275 [Deltaproteobacteria bacterium HGW-Deltaproteobacteria-20]|nr:MAG: hypothetical protein CVU63_03275 [Deltaproteobacteria bacterium HGW-Deltaproteobacteria-20]